METSDSLESCLICVNPNSGEPTPGSGYAHGWTAPSTVPSFGCLTIILTIGIVKDSYCAPGPSRKRTAQGVYNSKSYNQQNTSAHPH